MIETLPILIGLCIGFVGGYCIGSIPFGLVITRLAGLGDIRDIGSGNIGATNVLRTGRKGLALLTLICDSGKGAAAVIVFGLVLPFAALGAALGSVVGHLFPIWLKFKGGKGVATTLGALLAIAPLAGILTCGTWLAVAILFRISSLSALIAAAAAPIFAFISYGAGVAMIVLIMAILVFYKHRDNIYRLRAGTEPKIGQSKS
jgi:glycerol-3-phosphate acyltransferase PlsY